jgi:hypothetical protein
LRLRINGSWFLLKQHPRFMLSALHTESLGEEQLWFLGRQTRPVWRSNSFYFRQGTQRPHSAGGGLSGDFTLREVGLHSCFGIMQSEYEAWNSWWGIFKCIMYSEGPPITEFNTVCSKRGGLSQCPLLQWRITLVISANDFNAAFGWVMVYSSLRYLS